MLDDDDPSEHNNYVSERADFLLSVLEIFKCFSKRKARTATVKNLPNKQEIVQLKRCEIFYFDFIEIYGKQKISFIPIEIKKIQKIKVTVVVHLKLNLQVLHFKFRTSKA